jgi:hypothetical protein
VANKFLVLTAAMRNRAQLLANAIRLARPEASHGPLDADKQALRGRYFGLLVHVERSEPPFGHEDLRPVAVQTKAPSECVDCVLNRLRRIVEHPVEAPEGYGNDESDPRRRAPTWKKP